MRSVLLADIGGTYARFAIAEGRSVGMVWSTEVGSRPSAIDAIRAFLGAGKAARRIDDALLDGLRRQEERP